LIKQRRTWPLFFWAAMLVTVSYLAVNLCHVWWAGAVDSAREVDAIVVLGAAQYDGKPSPQLEARLDHVLGLWADGIAPRIIVTGGNRPGDRFTEASTSAEYLRDNGVPIEALLLEDAGTNTYDSLRTVSQMMKAAGLETAVVVTDPFHELRCVLILDQLDITAYPSATDSSPVRGWTSVSKHLKEMLGVSAGRILGFRRLLSITG
jgi:vancomycin permeability regulator SanA